MHELGQAVRTANDDLYAAIREAESKHAHGVSDQIESDFAHAGTEATAYIGGGGYIKRAWDLLKRPLTRARAAANALPVDMHGPGGGPSRTPTENASAWRSCWSAHGEYHPGDRRYDNEFAEEINNQLHAIKQEESNLKDEELMDLLESLLPNNDPNRDQNGQAPSQCPAEEVAEQIKADLDKRKNQKEEDAAASNILNKFITETELRTALERTPNYKAAGDDGIKGEFLRYLGDSAIEGLLLLYNFIFKHQLCPAGWTKDVAWPLYKKGVRRDPNNYRLITLMAVLAKVLERIMHTRLTEWTHHTQQAVIDPMQVGFQAPGQPVHRDGLRLVLGVFL